MKRFSFIGAGNMAYAIIGGMKDADITVYDTNSAQYEKFGNTVAIAPSSVKAVEVADYVFLAIKPQNFNDALAQIRQSGVPLDNKVFVSIAAGVKISSICKALGKEVAVIRTMPNTPLLIGKGVTALSRNALVSDGNFETIKNAFASCGKVFELPEDKMNAVIAATSSAPAYIYYIIDCIIKEAAAQGMDCPELTSAVCEMVKGSADMIMSTDKTPTELVKMVTSPNGTTEKAMNVLYENGLDNIISNAMKACTARAEELSAELDK